MEPAVDDHLVGLFLLPPVALQHDVGAGDDLADRLVVPVDFGAVFVDHLDLDADHVVAGAHLVAEPGGRAGLDLRLGLGQGEDRRGLGQAVDLDELPAQLVFEALDEGLGRRRAGDGEARAGGDFELVLALEFEDAGEHGRSHAGEGAALVLQQAVDVVGLGRAQDDMLAAHRGDRVDAAPAVGVEHGQRPEFGVAGLDSQMRDEVVGVDVGVAVGDHHALGAGGGAGGVVDAEQVGLVQLRIGGRGGRVAADPVLVVGPAGRDLRVAVGNGEVVLDGGDGGADWVYEVGELGVDHHHAGFGVLEDVLEVGGDQAVVDRDDHGADRGGGVEGLEELVAVGRDDRHAVALADAHRGERVGLLVDPLAELPPGEAPVAVDDGFGLGEQLGRAAQKIVDEQRDFHLEPPP